MSYLSFGEFAIGGGLDDDQLRLLAWRLVKYGADQDVCLIMGCNIPQQDVFEMLSVSKGDPPRSVLPFLATASPLEDTSDGLLSPYTLVTPGSGTDVKAIEGTLRRLQAVFAAALGENAIQTLTFCITEGFDSDLRPVFTSLSEFRLVAANMLVENDNWWPSVKFIVRRDAAA